MKISWSEALMKKFGEFVFAEKNTIFQNRLKYVNVNLFNYLIDWRIREGVNLRDWLAKQVADPFGEEIVLFNNWREIKNIDDRMFAIFRFVYSQYNYISDDKNWETPEHWSSLKESYETKNKRGDCEDGAIAMFVLARKSGMPENRIKVVAGDVLGGGHCWVLYSSNDANDYALDWCYWADLRDFADRPDFWSLDGYYCGDEIWFAVTDNSLYIKNG